MTGPLATLAWLRWRLWANGLRRGSGAVDTAAGLVLTLLGAVGSVVLAAALGVAAAIAMVDPDPDLTRLLSNIAFWTVAIIAVVIPVATGGAGGTFDLARLLHFPISRRSLGALALAGTALSGWTVAGWLGLLGIFVGLVVADGPIAGCAITVVLAGVSMTAWLFCGLGVVRWLLRGRAAREIAAIIAFALLFVVSLVPAMFDDASARSRLDRVTHDTGLSAVAARAVDAATLLPPGLATRAVFDLRPSSDARPWLAWAAQAVWAMVGLAGGLVAFGRTLDPAASGRRRDTAQAHRRSRPLLGTRAAGPVTAAAAVELRYLMRSVPGRIVVAAAPMFAVMTALLSRNTERLLAGLEPATWLFVGLLMYAVLFSNNFAFNAFAWEGTGVASWFLVPADPRTVILGKTVGLLAYDVVVATGCVLVWTLLVGPPPLPTFVGACLGWLVAVMVRNAIGLPMSVLAPVRRDPSTIGNSPSQTALFTSLATLLVIGGLVVACLAIGRTATGPWLAPALLAVCAAAAAGAWWASVGAAAALLDRRREGLVAALSRRAA